ncbi:hypothetical protein AC249_AIPGENE21559 [Exaiptasia diaphana]|nr:hypothetical protein AC249_AIPGENE21559 [Exaiptasia diaphana]
MSTSQSTNEDLIKLGERAYYTKVSRFNERVLIHIRKYYEPEEKAAEGPSLHPSKFGVALNIGEWNDLLEAAPSLNESVGHYSKLSRESEEKSKCGPEKAKKSKVFSSTFKHSSLVEIIVEEDGNPRANQRRDGKGYF